MRFVVDLYRSDGTLVPLLKRLEDQPIRRGEDE